MQSVKTVAVVGDSICFGYFPLVQEGLAHLDLNCVHVAGGSSPGLLSNLDEFVIQHQPDLVHFNCGLHDLCYRVDQENHQVELDAYEQNLRDNIGRLRRETSAEVIFATTTPVIEAYHNQSGNTHRYTKDVNAYNARSPVVMSELNVPTNNLHQVIVENGIETCVSIDGRHMTDRGNQVLTGAVIQAIVNNQTG